MVEDSEGGKVRRRQSNILDDDPPTKKGCGGERVHTATLRLV